MPDIDSSTAEKDETTARQIVTEWLGMFDPPPQIDFQQSEFLQAAIATTLRARLASMRDALEPFAKLIDMIECTTSHEYSDAGTWEVSIGDLRRARAAALNTTPVSHTSVKDGSDFPPDWKQDQAETSRLPRKPTGSDAVADGARTERRELAGEIEYCMTAGIDPSLSSKGWETVIAALRSDVAPVKAVGSTINVEDVSPLEIEITGPYLYARDKHPSLRLATADRLVASVYVIDDDEDRAAAEAFLIKEAFRLGGKEIDRIHYASGVDEITVKAVGSEALREIDRRLEDLAEANAIYGKDLRLNAPDKIARNDREISWLKDLRSIIAHPGSGDAEPVAWREARQEVLDGWSKYEAEASLATPQAPAQTAPSHSEKE